MDKGQQIQQIARLADVVHGDNGEPLIILRLFDYPAPVISANPAQPLETGLNVGQCIQYTFRRHTPRPPAALAYEQRLAQIVFQTLD